MSSSDRVNSPEVSPAQAEAAEAAVSGEGFAFFRWVMLTYPGTCYWESWTFNKLDLVAWEGGQR